MSDPARRTRRAIGLAFLASAVLLLFAGQTVLRDHLYGTRFALYWLLCLLLVTLAMAVALLDLFAVRHQARRQQLDLIQNTLGAPGTARPTARKPTDRDTHQTSTNRVRSADPEIQS
jgi:protein-S-isoprenylcysteine O-methyltransferase Ste14